MLKKKIEYVNFNGEKDSETLYFNLTEAEVVRLDLEFDGGLETYIGSLDEKTRPEDILHLFERILLMSYGEKSEDGKYFLKSEEETAMFNQSAAYSSLFIQLVQDVDQATAFFNELLTRTTIEVKPKSGEMPN